MMASSTSNCSWQIKIEGGILRAVGSPAVVGINSGTRTDKDDTTLGLAEGREGMLHKGNDREEVDIKVATWRDKETTIVGFLGEQCFINSHII
jgi:hypothetical protein